MSKLQSAETDALFRAVLSLETVEECYRFFEDLCTVSELQEMSRRMRAAKMLRDNTVYSEIAEKTGLSTATISRVNRALLYGANGYTAVLDAMQELEPGTDFSVNRVLREKIICHDGTDFF